jgi:hypothetical protein
MVHHHKSAFELLYSPNWFKFAKYVGQHIEKNYIKKSNNNLYIYMDTKN